VSIVALQPCGDDSAEASMWKFSAVHFDCQVEFSSEHKENATWLTRIVHILSTLQQILCKVLKCTTWSPKLVFATDQLSC
jgi:hypothetical protein